MDIFLVVTSIAASISTTNCTEMHLSEMTCYLSSGAYSTRSLIVQTWSRKNIHKHYIEWKWNNTLTRQLNGRRVFGCNIARSRGGPSNVRWVAISPSSSSESCCSCLLLLASCGLAWRELRTWLATDSAWYCNCFWSCSCSCSCHLLFLKAARRLGPKSDSARLAHKFTQTFCPLLP